MGCAAVKMLETKGMSGRWVNDMTIYGTESRNMFHKNSSFVEYEVNRMQYRTDHSSAEFIENNHKESASTNSNPIDCSSNSEAVIENEVVEQTRRSSFERMNNRDGILTTLPLLKKENSNSDNRSTLKSYDSNLIPAAILIQRWYRRYVARLEARRQCAWSIYQSIEYVGEQSQLRLYNFFYGLMRLTDMDNARIQNRLVFNEKERLSINYELPDILDFPIESTYKGLTLHFPLKKADLVGMVESFKKKEILHIRYVLQILLNARLAFKRMKNIYHLKLKTTTTINVADFENTGEKQLSSNYTCPPISKLTVVGDLHGKLDDLLNIFYKNGLPSEENPYLFNGDFVDRGENSVEIALLLFSFVLCYPNYVFINRGNHEDPIMNVRYGFTKEVASKYKNHTKPLLLMFEEVFKWLPLGTVIDGYALIVHGGISDATNLNYINNIKREKYRSILQPPAKDSETDESVIIQSVTDLQRIDTNEWRQMLDILWSDPKVKKGCQPNVFRGGGCYFGPDISESILNQYGLKYLIRSHECKQEGYEYIHDKKVLTVFSASNYYDEGSNKGAYLKLLPEMAPYIVQYVSNKKQQKKMTLRESVSSLEESAMKDLTSKIFAHKSMLMNEFKKVDQKKSGNITVNDWCQILSRITEMPNVPWRCLYKQLCSLSSNGNIMYETMFNGVVLIGKKGSSTSGSLKSKLKSKTLSGNNQNNQSITEALYRNKEELSVIFQAIDQDKSGFISLDEFREACQILSRQMERTQDLSIDNETTVNICKSTKLPTGIGEKCNFDFGNDETAIIEMAQSMDLNKDGFIDFNEFLETFRLVDNSGN
ncbi:hypothetical protein SNEBB_000111 [Seison nebaliae]|nr:hypothetical protein SNEBB_000111 [Seison nebaliae]